MFRKIYCYIIIDIDDSGAALDLIGAIPNYKVKTFNSKEMERYSDLDVGAYLGIPDINDLHHMYTYFKISEKQLDKLSHDYGYSLNWLRFDNNIAVFEFLSHNKKEEKTDEC